MININIEPCEKCGEIPTTTGYKDKWREHRYVLECTCGTKANGGWNYFREFAEVTAIRTWNSAQDTERRSQRKKREYEVYR